MEAGDGWGVGGGRGGALSRIITLTAMPFPSCPIPRNEHKLNE